jgi:hypothetical protein
LVLQTYLVFREPIFTPVDELPHTDYVRTIAEEGHLPIFGQTRTDPTLMAVYLDEYPAPFSLAGFRLPPYLFYDYEAIQFPVYYVVAAPLYRIFDRDPRVAIYALRMENVGFSIALLLLLMLLLRRIFPGRPDIAAFAPLTFLAMPGVSLRDSQVTNQVLAMLLLGALFSLLLKRHETRPARVAFAEGALLGIAVLTKITVIGAGPSVLAAWATRPGGLRTRLLPGSAGFLVAVSPWLAWSYSVYRSPLPWTTAHIDAICSCPVPKTIGIWKAFVQALWINFVLPFEWAGSSGSCTPTCTPIGPHTALMKVGLVVAAVLAVGAVACGLYALRETKAATWRPALLALLAIAGVGAGILGLDVSLTRFWSTDLREVYVFAAPMVILLATLAANFDRRVVILALGAVLIIWVAIDYQMYTSAVGCPGCPPSYFRVPASP